MDNVKLLQKKKKEKSNSREEEEEEEEGEGERGYQDQIWVSVDVTLDLRRPAAFSRSSTTHQQQHQTYYCTRVSLEKICHSWDDFIVRRSKTRLGNPKPQQSKSLSPFTLPELIFISPFR